MNRNPYKRLEDLVPGLHSDMPIERALDLIADKLEALDRARNITMIPGPGYTPRRSRVLKPGRYEFSFPADRHVIEVNDITTQTTPLHPNWIEIPNNGIHQDFVLEGDDEKSLCVKPFSYPTSGQALAKRQGYTKVQQLDAVFQKRIIAAVKAMQEAWIYGNGTFKVEMDPAAGPDSTVVTKSCKHEWKNSYEKPGTQWCNQCGERK